MTNPAPSPSAPKLPVSLAANPVLSSWVKFSAEGHVMVSPGKVEIGQGIVTALAQIAADELDVDMGRVQMVRGSTAASPNEGVTSGSLSVQQSGRAIRYAWAEIRQMFLDAASDRLGVDSRALEIKDGTISGPGNVRTSYWELADEIPLDREATPGAVPKSSAQRTLAGNSVQRLDIPDKVFAHPRFIHDQALAGMLHYPAPRSALSAAKLGRRAQEGPRGNQDQRLARPQFPRPYLAHASIAPSCAMAQWTGDRVQVWTHSQGVYFLRADLALVLKLPLENITVEHMEGAGCYGHNAADDVALDAVLLAKAAAGRLVRVQWSRADEMSHAPFGAAIAIAIHAGPHLRAADAGRAGQRLCH